MALMALMLKKLSYKFLEFEQVWTQSSKEGYLASQIFWQISI